MMPIAVLCGHSSEVLARIATFGREAPVFGAQYIPTANGPRIKHLWFLSFWHAMCILHMAQALYISEFYHFDTQCVYYIWPKHYTFLSFITLTRSVYITYGPSIIHFWVLSFWYSKCILHMAQALYISEFYHFDTQCVYYLWLKHYTFLSFIILIRKVYITYGPSIIYFWVSEFWQEMCILQNIYSQYLILHLYYKEYTRHWYNLIS